MSGKRKPTPLIWPTRKPGDIVSQYFDSEDLKAFIDHLSVFKKTQANWHDYRARIPDPLLARWWKIMSECRKQGYVNPHIKDGKIVWSQVVGNPKHADPCTLCPETYQDNACKGHVGHKDGHFDFTPCWQRERC